MLFTTIGCFFIFCSFALLLMGEFFNAFYILLIGALFLFIGRKIKKEQEKQREEYSNYYNKNKIIKNEKIKSEYNDFVYSTSIKTGMPIEEVKKALRNQPFVTDQEIATPKSWICPTCGGNVINGKCQYCGNVYENNSDIVVLSYSCKYGNKSYTFKNGVLDKIYTHANPIENFLI